MQIDLYFCLMRLIIQDAPTTEAAIAAAGAPDAASTQEQVRMEIYDFKLKS